MSALFAAAAVEHYNILCMNAATNQCFNIFILDLLIKTTRKNLKTPSPGKDKKINVKAKEETFVFLYSLNIALLTV